MNAAPSRSASVLSTIVRLRCPRCGQGPLFRGWFRMLPACEHCGLDFRREPGFFLGSIYVNYGAASVIAGTTYVVLTMAFGWPPPWVLTGCLAFTVIFPLWFFRYARAVFFAVDYYANPQRHERITSSSASSTTAGAESPPREFYRPEELEAMRRDDASAGLIMVVLVGLAILFGLIVTIAVVASVVLLG
ncbi:MAG: DUF983 domain-containing protein [Pirellulales bacterium]|nr:DUF983 domain-containing protein [Pirellulales bacterium]